MFVLNVTSASYPEGNTFYQAQVLSELVFLFSPVYLYCCFFYVSSSPILRYIFELTYLKKTRSLIYSRPLLGLAFLGQQFVQDMSWDLHIQVNNLPKTSLETCISRSTICSRPLLRLAHLGQQFNQDISLDLHIQVNNLFETSLETCISRSTICSRHLLGLAYLGQQFDQDIS